jgi:hypothetical protein
LSNNRQNFPGFSQGGQRRFAGRDFKLVTDWHLKANLGTESHHDLIQPPASAPFDDGDRVNQRFCFLQSLVSFWLTANYHVVNMADTQKIELTLFWLLFSQNCSVVAERNQPDQPERAVK